MPYEARIRRWLARARLPSEDIDDVMQEAYYRIAKLPAVDHIDEPLAYMFAAARNIALRRLKRQRVVVFAALSEVDNWHDEAAPTPEEQAGARMNHDRVMAIIAALPERCRRIVELRKIEGWSQKEIAAHLGLSEKAVEKQIWTGVRAIRQAWAEAEARSEALLADNHTRGRGAW